MAKRKRLTPPRPGFLEAAAPAPETAAAPPGLEPRPARPPIAQVAGDTATSAALGELAAEMEAARAEGRLALHLPLGEIDARHLVRDRLTVEGEELDELMSSLRARGQRTPIEVVDRGGDAAPRYGLISGWRRLSALRRLAQEDPAFGRAAAIVRAPESASDAYVSMVEENEIRLGLSHYERARIVVKAREAGVFDDDGQALRTLFGNVSKAKRSKIRSFVALVRALDDVLRFPAAIREADGLRVAQYLKERPDGAERLRSALAAAPAPTEGEERAVLLAALPSAATDSGVADSGPPDAAPEPASPAATPNAGEQRSTPSSPSLRSAVSAELSRGRLTLSGPGVDAELLAALDAWLRRRGHPEA